MNDGFVVYVFHGSNQLLEVVAADGHAEATSLSDIFEQLATRGQFQNDSNSVLPSPVFFLDYEQN